MENTEEYRYLRDKYKEEKSRTLGERTAALTKGIEQRQNTSAIA